MLDPAFREEVMRYKYRGSSGKVNLALDGLPELACKPGKGEWLRGAISFSPSIDYIEHAYDDAKYGRPSARPYLATTAMATAIRSRRSSPPALRTDN